MKNLFRFSLLAVLNLISSLSFSQTTAIPGHVVITGAVPDEATKAALIARLEQVYGTGQIVDQLTVGGVVAPPNWSTQIPKLVNASLKSISKGQLVADGTTVTVRGEVANDNIRQSIATDYANTLSGSYVVKNALRVSTSGQAMLDQTLGNRTVEFENGSAMLTDDGKRILGEMAEALKKVSAKRIELIGHTDNQGDASRNLALSRYRAESVKTYLVAKGINPSLIATSGMGADQPLVANDSEDGRKRNRRIEFRVGQ